MACAHGGVLDCMVTESPSAVCFRRRTSDGCWKLRGRESLTEDGLRRCDVCSVKNLDCKERDEQEDNSEREGHHREAG
jgi:hypothetical protein